jgi:hypothetical protein
MDFHIDKFVPDPCEAAYADVAQAHAMLRERRPDLPVVMAHVGASFLSHFGAANAPLLKLVQDALSLSFVRMASRHGTWGHDPHSYHNEEHALELLNGRLARVRLQLGWAGLEIQEWVLLALFSTCHDLRQRETPPAGHDASGAIGTAIGANERASIAETHRLLHTVGFDRSAHAEYYDSLAWMIAGSTFDARPESPDHARIQSDSTDHSLNSAQLANSGGSLSTRLLHTFVTKYPGYLQDPVQKRRARMILLSADLDTANVGEPFMALVGSAVRLVREREMRAGRALSGARGLESGDDVLEFLTDGQDRYFFKLHRFVSDIGRDVFGLGKTLNSPKLKRLTDQLRAQFQPSVLARSSGQDIIDAFEAGARAIG